MKKMGIATYATLFAAEQLKLRKKDDPNLTPEQEETYKLWISCVFLRDTLPKYSKARREWERVYGLEQDDTFLMQLPDFVTPMGI